jgi:hypothetical protein
MGEHCFPYPKFELMQEIGDKQREKIEIELGEPKGKRALTGHLLVDVKYE